MANENNANIRDTITAIDFIRTARIYAPSENEIIQNMLFDYEKIFLERLLQLLRNKETDIADHCNIAHRDNFTSGGRSTQMNRQEKILAYFKARVFFCSLDTQAPKGNEVVFSYLKKTNEAILAELFRLLKSKKE